LEYCAPYCYFVGLSSKGRKTMDVIKVKANSRTAAVAGAIAGIMREHKHADIQAIGAGAVNQAVKALVLAKGYLAEDGIPVACVPEFVDVEIDGKVRTAIKLVVDPVVPVVPKENLPAT
jgi:stage V sporulation protein S